MSPPTVAVFAMPEAGHVRRLLPLVAGLTAAGAQVEVFTESRFAPEVERAGGRFVDLFARYPLDRVDSDSRPVPCRYVTFAGAYADDVVADLRALDPALIVYDTFAVVGWVAARALGVPYVNVCAGHDLNPQRHVPLLAADPRVALAPACLRAVEVLRDRHGVADASPFSYLSGLSPFLNVYCEPPAFLTAEERRAYEPIAFHGSLPSVAELDDADGGEDPWPQVAGRRLYVSFGTVVWRYWAREALASLAAIAAAVGARDDVRGLIGLGGADVPAQVARGLERENVRVAGYVDQRAVLRSADAFVTHHGLNSTHEAIYHRVPMLSHPFFADQPALAERCRELGLAVPLAETPRGPVTEEAVGRALDEVWARSAELVARLEEARGWELETIVARPAVVQRILALAGAR